MQCLIFPFFGIKFSWLSITARGEKSKEVVGPICQLLLFFFVVQMRWAETFAFTLPDLSLPLPWDVPTLLEESHRQLCLQVLWINWLCLTVVCRVQSTAKGLWAWKEGEVCGGVLQFL